MAGTEDVSEKVADILFDQIARAGSGVLHEGEKLLNFLGTSKESVLSRFLDGLMKERGNFKDLLGIEGEISAVEMSEVVRRFALASSTTSVADADSKDFESLLKERGVLYAKTSAKDDDCMIYFFLNRDRAKVDEASQILRANRGTVTELSPDLYINSLSPDKVQVIQGLSRPEVELFRYYAREMGILFTTMSKNDEHMIVANASDAEKTRKALLHIGWDLTGANGARVKEQIEHRLAGRQAINIAADEAEREVYIVSGLNPSNYIKITADDLVQYKQDKEVSRTARSAPGFAEKCMALADSLAHPIVLSELQWRPGLTAQDLSGAQTMDLFPSDYDEFIQMEQARRLANLVDQKLQADKEQQKQKAAMDKTNREADMVSRKSDLDDEYNATWGIYDASVSYSEFAGYEYIADEDERDAREYEFEHFKEAALYAPNHFTIQDVDMEGEKDLDYIIAKADRKRRAMAGEDLQRDQRPSHNKGNAQPFASPGSDRDDGRE